MITFAIYIVAKTTEGDANVILKMEEFTLLVSDINDVLSQGMLMSNKVSVT